MKMEKKRQPKHEPKPAPKHPAVPLDDHDDEASDMSLPDPCQLPAFIRRPVHLPGAV
jgi:hypothetical protein